MVRTKTTQKVHIDKLKVVDNKLGDLKEKPKEELTLRESIYFLRDKLKSALKKGYSYQDLSEILSEQEIFISAATLKQYLTEIKKKSSSSKRSRAGQKEKSKSSSSESSLNKSSGAVDTSQKESDKDLNEVEPEGVKELEQVNSPKDTESYKLKSSLDDSQEESTKTQRTTKKFVKTKPKESLKANQDLSGEFNQY